jgi:hypothetical protein
MSDDVITFVHQRWPGVPKALNALAVMERELDAAENYESLRKIERKAEALKILFKEVDAVRQQAETVIILAKARIGKEILAVPKANKHHQSSTHGRLTHGREALGIPPATRSRLTKLAEIPQPELRAITKQIQDSGGDATVAAVLKTVAAKQAAEPEQQPKLHPTKTVILHTHLVLLSQKVAAD